MKLKFEPNLDFQLQAINSIVDIFEGQSKQDEGLKIVLIDNDETQLFGEINGIGNRLIISEEQIYKNINEIRKNNEI